MDPQTIFNLNIVSFVLNAIGCILLSALILTISLSRRLASRDPVVCNFIFTWILRSALGSYDLLATLAGKQVDEVREETIGMATIVAGFNFSVHIWFIMHGAFHQISPKATDIRTLVLVVTPYLFGLLPLPSLFTTSIAVSAVWAITAVLFSVANSISSVVLLVYYFRTYRKLQKANVQDFLSLPFLFRLLAFGSYINIFDILAFANGFFEGLAGLSTVFLLLKSLYPIMAFCILGLHGDILQLWFPCCWKRTQLWTAIPSLES